MPQLSLQTPAGALTVSESDGAIVSVDWGWGRDQTPTRLLLAARDQLQAYFDGDLIEFDLPLNAAGTPYRRVVWAVVRAIPYGATRAYIDIAREAGGSPRAVGGAMAANPLPVLVPCHRVLAAGGIGGYSGGNGLATKRFLLALETHRTEQFAA